MDNMRRATGTLGRGRLVYFTLGSFKLSELVYKMVLLRETGGTCPNELPFSYNYLFFRSLIYRRCTECFESQIAVSTDQ